MQSVGRSGARGSEFGHAQQDSPARQQTNKSLLRHKGPAPLALVTRGTGNILPALVFLSGLAGALILAINITHTLAPGLAGEGFVVLSGALAGLVAAVLGVAWWRQRSALCQVAAAQHGQHQSGASGKFENERRELLRRYHEAKIRADAADRAKVTFLAHLNHDLRTPLNHIIGFADLIGHQALGPLGDERYVTYANDISRSGKQLLVSLSDVLELAEFDSGAKVLSIQNVSVVSLFSALRARFEGAARRAGVHLDIKNPGEVRLNGDVMCLQRMLGNLVENAIRFTPAGGRIYVDAWIADDGIVLEVTDTGVGIAQTRIKTLSEPFNMDDALLARTKGGMGLGLAISRVIAELSGGQLAIQSTPGIGTTVAISLPVNAKAGLENTAAA